MSKFKMKKKAPNPGRIPTAKGSIRHKSKKDYNRQQNELILKNLEDLACDECSLPVALPLKECLNCKRIREN